MQVIKLQEPYDKQIIPQSQVVLCLGFFDGVHRGHQQVILTAQKKARQLGAKLAVLTLDRYPGLIFAKEQNKNFTYLTSLQQKLQLLEKLGVDTCYIASFTPTFYQLSQQAFADKYLRGLNAVCVVAGSDYTYGKDPKQNYGDMAHLSAYLNQQIEVIEVEHLMLDNQKISSTVIRAALDQGDLSLARDLLGYSYTTEAKVVHGFERGRTLGFPTLNLELLDQVRIPKEGVYATWVKFEDDDQWYMGMASIGRNETFGEDFAVTIEINLLNFSKMVYGKKVLVKWEQYLRPMQKFNGPDALIAQLKLDQVHTKEVLTKGSSLNGNNHLND